MPTSTNIVRCFLTLLIQYTSADPTTPQYVSYNSSDLSYLSNGIQFPVPTSLETVSSIEERSGKDGLPTKLEWLNSLYDHHNWAELVRYIDGKQCQKDLMVYIDGLRNESVWAARMYDASGRYNSHFFFGNDFWLGSKTQCIEAQNKDVHSILPPFKTNFNIARVRININEELTPVTRQLIIGQCLPSSCEPADITNIFLHEKSRAKSLQVVDVRRVPGAYRLSQDVKFHIVGGVFLFVFILIILATLVEVFVTKRKTESKEELEQQQDNNNVVDNMGKSQDVLHKKQEKETKNKEGNSKGVLLQLLLSFSLISNGKKILSLDKLPIDSIRCIHGMRFFSIAWIIMVHTYLEVFSIADNKAYRQVTERNFLYQTVSNATFSVDTFFYISGLLVTLTYFRSASSRLSPPPPAPTVAVLRTSALRFLLLIFYRFVRLTPAYLFVLGVNELTLRYIHSNSIYSPAIIDHISCDAYWWRNALYINNFYPQHEFCMLWSWYMANDTQFYVLAVVLLLVAVRSERNCKLAAIAILVFLVTSWITTFIIAMQNNFVARVEEPFALFDQLYDKPWMRIGPYFVGMFTGYFLFKRNGERIELRPALVALGWFLCMLCLFALVYGLGRDGLVTPVSAIYASLGHTAWGLALAWITVACIWGYGGPANAVLTFRGFLPLSRLSYCAYLIHPVLMVVLSFLLDAPIHLAQLNVLVVFLGNTVISFVVALAISLAFEAPIVRLLKVTMSPNSKSDD